MDIRSLRYFVGIAESRTLTEASIRLHIVQPALSQRLSDLEKSLQTQLVVRSRAGTALTPAGAELYDSAKRILKQIDIATAAVKEKGGIVEGVLTIGLLRSMASLLSVRLFTELREAMPGVRPQIRLGYSAELEELLRNGQLDLATLVSEPGLSGGREMAFSEGLRLVGPPSLLDNLARTPRLKDVQGLRLLISPMQPAYALVMKLAAQQGLELDVMGGIEDVMSILELCRAGMGATILTSFGANWAAGRHDLDVLPLAEVGLTRHLRVAMQHDTHRSAAVLVAESILGRLLGDVLHQDCAPEPAEVVRVHA
ncbi:LysR family transcriptional regulator [Hydrogenophaga sp.]|uniref:LysR family transcriptional regulator n=1 Tax=Hydrogenophaga sp. TaxID=1904254 RepID=UPI0027280C41|nr:LysR family transcriptional regulator [Hydrogenophaga sp.]MDO9437818.1 LysR family transcriptional regulator [Hydrogenophaga sp.]